METALTEEKIAELKTCLLERREELRAELLTEHSRGDEEPSHEVRHGGEEYLDKLIKDVGTEISDLRVQEIRDIDAALQRIAIGRYGVCLECDEPISHERLQAFPAANLCYDCKEDYERHTRG